MDFSKPISQEAAHIWFGRNKETRRRIDKIRTAIDKAPLSPILGQIRSDLAAIHDELLNVDFGGGINDAEHRVFVLARQASEEIQFVEIYGHYHFVPKADGQ